MVNRAIVWDGAAIRSRGALAPIAFGSSQIQNPRRIERKLINCCGTSGRLRMRSPPWYGYLAKERSRIIFSTLSIV